MLSDNLQGRRKWQYRKMMTRSLTQISAKVLSRAMTVVAAQLVLTRAGMKLIVFGSSDSGDNEFDSNLDIDQSIEQSKACSGGSTCSNSASNVANVG